MDTPFLNSAAHYRDGQLYIEDVELAELAARFGTPLYVYSAGVVQRQYAALQTALTGITPQLLICYALKANANPALGSILARLGAGADVVSGGELYLALRMGFPPEKIVFAGVGKTRRELEEGLTAGVRTFHVESAAELDLLAQVAAELRLQAPVSVRINPNVDAHTHPHITTGTSENKFGVAPEAGLDIMRRAASHEWLRPVGLHAHIGSQLTQVQPIIDSTRRLLDIWDTLAREGITLRELDVGGGLGIPYRPGDDPQGPDALADGLRSALAGRDIELVVEPGRYLVGPAGVLLTTVTYIKPTATKQLAVVDAGMNDLLRPALYDAYHPAWPVVAPSPGSGSITDVVGPVCELADVLARDRDLGAVKAGGLLAVGQAGAYGFSMASQYNGRPRPAEVLVSGHDVRLIRQRETYDDLVWLRA